MVINNRTTDPLLVVSLTDGLANRNRLPLNYVLKVLREVESMINDLGSRLLKERGVEDPHPDFGIELVAEDGIAFTKGSVRATIAITRYQEVGLLAAGEVIRTVGELSVKNKQSAVVIEPAESLTARVVHSLEKIAFINQTAKTKTNFEVIAPKTAIKAANMDRVAARRATFGDVAVENLKALRVPSFEETNVRLYGKLFRLKDNPAADDRGKTFWGELHRENGERWRIQFQSKDLLAVTPLFTQQVLVTGKAVYYHSASPKLEAEHIEKDLDRDFVSAYRELYGCDRDLAPA